MSEHRRSREKIRRLGACANSRGLITAIAVDHRAPMEQALAAARGGEPARPGELSAFKSAVARILGPHASAILTDPTYGLGQRPPRGLLLAYEKVGYDAGRPGGTPDLIPGWSVRRMSEAGADGVKVLLYYNPFEGEEINAPKQALVERIGAECVAHDMPFFLEPLAYDTALGSGPEFARRMPEYVRGAISEFTRPRYGADVLKIQAPVDPRVVAGTRSSVGRESLFSRQQALEGYRRACAGSTLPLVFLSAGVGDDTFMETLELAAEAGAPISGVASGRATWQEGLALLARQGEAAMEEWLATEGVRRVVALNSALALSATPWWNPGA